MWITAVSLYRGSQGAPPAPADGDGDQRGAAQRVVGEDAVVPDPLLAIRGAATGRVSRGWKPPPVSSLGLGRVGSSTPAGSSSRFEIMGEDVDLGGLIRDPAPEDQAAGDAGFDDAPLL